MLSQAIASASLYTGAFIAVAARSAVRFRFMRSAIGCEACATVRSSTQSLRVSKEAAFEATRALQIRAVTSSDELVERLNCLDGCQESLGSKRIEIVID